MKEKRIPLLVKILLIQAIFLFLHYLPDWFPNNLTSLFSGINESVYQHMKLGYFSYLLFAVIEFFSTRKSIRSFDRYLYARLFSAAFLPLAMMVIYLSGPLVFGRLENMVLEIVFGNAALLATSFSTLTVERHIEKTKPGFTFCVVIAALFVLSFAQFIAFTIRVPWFDIFAIPPGY